MEKLKKLLPEALVIVCSVMLATYLENLRQHLDEQETVKEFLLGLKTDLTNDIAEMRSDKRSYDYNKTGFTYFAQLQGKKDLNADSVKKYQSLFYSTTSLVTNSGGYEGFKSSGKMYSIQNRELGSAILDLYQEAIPLLLNSTGSFIERKQRLTRYFEDHQSLGMDGRPETEKLIQNPPIKNLCNSLIYVDELQQRYDTCLALSKKIVDMIDGGYR